MSASCPQLGFEVTFHLDASLDAEAWSTLRADFAAMLDARGLSSRGGAVPPDHWGYIIWREGSQAEHADREAIREWAENQREIISAAIGDLIDIDITGQFERRR
jgi:uncharacterized protein YggL (DUF469 family)